MKVEIEKEWFLKAAKDKHVQNSYRVIYLFYFL